jgi:hypothetical protein
MDFQKHIDTISGKDLLPDQFSSIILSLYLFQLKTPSIEENEKVQQIISLIQRKIDNKNIHLANSQMDYAIRLSDSRFDLEYEEMHKLFSLLNQIYAIEKMGFTIDVNKKNEFEKSVRTRFEKEHQKARLVAEDKFDDWNQHLWWFAENLSKK